ncbi:unnamed protein product [Phyllotreta striolata]|uniref:Uncharacterized protein n=1 Tax=Phyllotreta striolata TaxID=444603 RepID=A0A9N9TH55_PHYSR|nr:unnamed protein product [Phyllotreta striolata]
MIMENIVKSLDKKADYQIHRTQRVANYFHTQLKTIYSKIPALGLEEATLKPNRAETTSLKGTPKKIKFRSKNMNQSLIDIKKPLDNMAQLRKISTSIRDKYLKFELESSENTSYIKKVRDIEQFDRGSDFGLNSTINGPRESKIDRLKRTLIPQIDIITSASMELYNIKMGSLKTGKTLRCSNEPHVMNEVNLDLEDSDLLDNLHRKRSEMNITESFMDEFNATVETSPKNKTEVTVIPDKSETPLDKLKSFLKRVRTQQEVVPDIAPELEQMYNILGSIRIKKKPDPHYWMPTRSSKLKANRPDFLDD